MKLDLAYIVAALTGMGLGELVWLALTGSPRLITANVVYVPLALVIAWAAFSLYRMTRDKLR